MNVISFSEWGGTLDGRLFDDGNADGAFQAATDTPLPGIAVSLGGNAQDGQPVCAAMAQIGVLCTTSTDASGNFVFSNIVPAGPAVSVFHTGPYPPGVAPLNAFPGAAGGSASGLDTISGMVLPQAPAAPSNIFTFAANESLQGIVYVDRDNDGQKAASEPGIPSVQLTLQGLSFAGLPVNETATTNAAGQYTFTGIPPSDATGYTITQQSQAAAPLSMWADGTDAAGSLGGTAGNDVISGIVVNLGQSGTDYLFGELGAALPATSFRDDDNDGIRDGGEPGIGGVAFTLSGTLAIGGDACTYLAALVPAQSCSATTDASGNLTFVNLPAGAYNLVETQPSSLVDGIETAGAPQGGAVSAAFSAAAPDNTIAGMTVSPGLAGGLSQFGNTTTSVSGTIWASVNTDNVLDAPQEFGVAGFTLTLTGADFNGNPVSLTTTTGPGGAYTFNGVPLSDALGYDITVTTAPANYTLTAMTGFAGSAGGSPGGPQTSDIVIASGAATGYNFISPLGRVRAFVLHDVNQSGTPYAPGPDLPIAVVPVQLTGFDAFGAPVSRTATTDATGAAIFLGLLPSGPAGYTLTETQPPSYASPVISPNVHTFNLAPGATITHFFGEVRPTISGVVYDDVNRDGSRQIATENGLAGGFTITVSGTQAGGGAFSQTATSDASGNWTMPNVPLGAYTVSVAPLSPYTPNSVGTDVASQGILLTSDTNVTANFAMVTGAVSGIVFDDYDLDGVLDPGEPGVPGFTMTLNGPGGPLVTISDGAGAYSFTNLANGSYTLTQTQLANWNSTQPVTGGVVNLSVSGGGQVDLNWGETQAGTITGNVWSGVNANNVFEVGIGELQVGNVVVQLTGNRASDGSPVTLNATTNGVGAFSIVDAPVPTAAGYTLQIITLPAAWNSAIAPTAFAGSAGGTVVLGTITGIIPPLAGSATDNNFVLAGASARAFVWHDVNNDGVFTGGTDLPIQGVTVTLAGTDAGGNSVTRPPAVTDVNGEFFFLGLPNGTYTVTESQPSSYISRPGSPDTVGGIVVSIGGAAGLAEFIELQPTVSGRIYRDVDLSGTFNAGDLALNGAAGGLVTLTYGVTTRTAAPGPLGQYSFDNVPANTPLLFSVAAYPAHSFGNTLPDIQSQAVSFSTLGPNAVNFAFVQSQITGRVFNETVTVNNNQAGGEPGLQNWTVNITGPVTTSVLTDAAGDFIFPSLPDGTYSVSLTPQPGFVFSPGSGSPISVNITGGAIPPGLNFALYQPGSAQGFVVLDVNNNIAPDVGGPDTGLANIPVQILDGLGNVAGQDLTDATGAWSVANLVPGTYTVQVVPAPYIAVSPNPVAGVVVPPGGASANTNFALNQGSVSGVVFIDAIVNGALDGGELPAPDAVVQLFDAGTNALVATAVATQAGGGTWSMPAVAPGNYVIRVQVIGALGYNVSPGHAVYPIPVTIGGGPVVQNVGVVRNGVAGNVYRDDDEDGTRDPGEPGLGNVTVSLFQAGTLNPAIVLDQNGAPIINGHITTTLVNGDWQILGVVAGAYDVVQTQPVAFGSTTPNTIPGVNVTTNTLVNNQNFGEQRGSITGTVFLDLDGDGTFDAGEPTVDNVTLTLSGVDFFNQNVTPPSAISAGGGLYNFGTSSAGVLIAAQGGPGGTNYTLTVDPASIANYFATTATVFTIPNTFTGADDLVFNVGLSQLGIRGTVFRDLDYDSTLDAGEPGLATATLLLQGGALPPAGINVPLNGAGQYQLLGLPPGAYTLTETDPAGYGSSTPNVQNIVLAHGTPTPVQTVDFGDILGRIEGRVFVDPDTDGIIDAGEAGQNGVQVTLTGATLGGLPLPPATFTVTLGQDGSYVFNNVPAGTYTVSISVPGGFQPTLPVGGSIALPPFTPAVAPSQQNFGIVPAASGSVTGRVWADYNANGVYDPGTDAALFDVQIQAVPQGGGPTVTVLTQADGTYQFTGLAPGNYDIIDTQHPLFASITPDTVTVAVGGGPAPVVNFREQGGALTARVYRDVNNNGLFDAGDIAQANTPVEIVGSYSRVSASGTFSGSYNLVVLTDASGFYTLEDLPSGTYTVSIDEPTGFVLSPLGEPIIAGSPRSATRTVNPLAPGATEAFNFPLLVQGVQGVVFRDLNQDCASLACPPSSAAETGIFGTQIELRPVGGGPGSALFTAFTQPNGNYSFISVPSGAYDLVEIQPAGYGSALTSPNVRTITVASNTVLAHNFAETLSTFNGIVFLDLNGNGIEDPADTTLIAGATITVAGTGADGSAVLLTVSSLAGGPWELTGIIGPNAAGYTVTMTPPAGFSGTTLPNPAIWTSPAGFEGIFNFGVATASVTGQVLRDNNRDNNADPGDTGIGGVVVRLCADAACASVVSSAVSQAGSGGFSFNGVALGSYFVVETQPAGYGDAAGALGVNVRPVTVTAGVATPPVVFLDNQARISGTVFRDSALNPGVLDAGETGLAGFTVTLTGPVNLTFTTAANGQYSFDNLPIGNYTVAQVPPAGWTSTTSPDSFAFNFTTGQAVVRDFGRVSGDISGIIYRDADRDGIRDAGEGGLNGVTVELRDAGTNALVQTTTTALGGAYSFSGLGAGNYLIQALAPNGEALGPPPNLSPLPATLAANGTLTGQNIGLIRARIEGFVYIDANGNAVSAATPPDAGEAGIAGIQIRLTGTDVNAAPVGPVTVLTDANGFYAFENLLAGAYTVEQVVQPALYASVTPNIVTLVPDLAAGTVRQSHFAEAQSGVAGLVWVNADGDATQDGGELGLGGVTIELRADAGGVPGALIATTTTDALGNYTFPVVAPGAYFLVQTQPVLYASQTSANPALNFPNIRPITATSGSTGVVNFAEVAGSISGFVYIDLDANATRDPLVETAGLSSVLITLTGFDALGAAIPPRQISTVAPDGAFSFSGLPAGTYVISQPTQPAGYVSTEQPTNQVSGFVLAAGANSTVNFGENQSGIQGVVFSDLDRDGTRDGGEPGQGSFTITLTGPVNPPPVISAVGTGAYAFLGLPPGNYTLTLTPDPAYGYSTPTTLNVVVAASAIQTVNFGVTTASITGIVYVDANANAVDQTTPFDVGLDTPIAGVTLTLTGPSLPPGGLVTVTGPSGAYSFSGLLAGVDYTLTQTQPAGFGSVTTNVVAYTGAGALTGGQAVVANFAESQSTLSVFVFNDLDADGTADPGEPGMGNVAINVASTAPGGPTFQGFTDATGNYSVIVPAGTYTVTETQPAGFGSSTPNTLNVNVAANGTTNASFGNTSATVTVLVCNDLNGNGVCEAGEPGLANAPVTLSGGGLSAPVTQNSDASGNVAFTGLMSGAYNLAAAPPAGFGLISASPLALNVPAGGAVTGQFAMGQGNVIGTVTNAQSGAPISGVTVNVLDGSGNVVATATTNAAGNYTAGPLPAGAYTVVAVPPPGGTVVANNQPVSVTAGATSPVNFQINLSAISGIVFRDLDADCASPACAPEPGEPLYAGATITLSGPGGTQTATSDATGAFSFPSAGGGALSAGVYTLTIGPTPGFSPAFPTVTVTLGSGQQSAGNNFPLLERRATGAVYHDLDEDGVRDAGEPGIGGVTIEVLNSSAVVVGSTVTAADGSWQVALAPGAYVIREIQPAGWISTQPANNQVSVTVTAAQDAIANFGETLTAVTGVIYDAALRVPVQGALVEIRGPAAFDPAIHLFGGLPAAQVTTGANGAYRFALTASAPAGNYGIVVIPPASGAFATNAAGEAPSSQIVPDCGTLTAGSGAVVVVQSNAGPPTQAAPSNCTLGGTTTAYFDTLSLQAGAASVVNNHWPIDPAALGQLVVSKTTEQLTVQRGQPVGYVITVTNPTAGALPLANLIDRPPPGFAYRAGSALIDGVAVEPTRAPDGTLTWSNLTVPPGDTLNLQLVLVVGAGVREGDHVNQAFATYVGLPGLASNIAEATVRLVPSVEFDCTDVIGKAFDDRNGNGAQDPGEPGIAGARIATVTGQIVTTDADGRYHIACITVPNRERGSNVSLKLDERSLPAGWRLTTDNPETVRATRGRVVRVNFGATLTQLVRLSMDARAFTEAGAPTEGLEATLQELVPQLRLRVSTVRLAYARGPDESADAAAARIRAVAERLEAIWAGQANAPRLIVESETLTQTQQGERP